MRVVALVPRRSGEPYRDASWNWIWGRFRKLHPDIRIWEGNDNRENTPFNRALAINIAAHAANEWDVAIIMDSDSFVGPDRLREAVDTAMHTGRLTVAFEKRAHVRKEMSQLIMDGYAGPWEPGVADWLDGHCSGMIAVRRDLWERVGGFDEGFEAPGAEDVAFAIVATDLGGGRERTPGVLWHLWHPIRSESTKQNNERLDRYLALHAAGDVYGYRALRAEHASS